MNPICVVISGNGYRHRYYEDFRLDSQKLRGVVPSDTIAKSYQGAVKFEFSGRSRIGIFCECGGWALSGCELIPGIWYPIFPGAVCSLETGGILLELRVE